MKPEIVDVSLSLFLQQPVANLHPVIPDSGRYRSLPVTLRALGKENPADHPENQYDGQKWNEDRSIPHVLVSTHSQESPLCVLIKSGYNTCQHPDMSPPIWARVLSDLIILAELVDLST
jgi:hypothetical protein